MTKKLKRTRNFEFTLEIKNDDFIRPPKDSQRNALLNKVLNEFSRNLDEMDEQASRFVAGNTRTHFEDRTNSDLIEGELMEDWQIPIMQAMAGFVAESHGDILEIGFGRGISSSMIQEQKVRSHTIIECNGSVVKKFYDWKKLFAGEDIRLVHGLWQETVDDLGLFDGIFFHTYPLNEEEYMKYVHGSITFAEHFFETAAGHLRPDGVFTYFSNEIDSLSRSHQRLIFKHFSSFELRKISLDVPEETEDSWWADSIVVIRAVK
jgi:guanidinoacetate N-methyltransferase